MNEAELQSFLLALSGAIDAQFNFWMATTFAVVIASYVAGNHFNRIGRFGVVVLYILACSVFYSRYLTLTGQVGMAIGQLAEVRNSAPHSRFGIFTLIARQVLMLGGTAFAVVIVVWPNLLRRNDVADSDE